MKEASNNSEKTIRSSRQLTTSTTKNCMSIKSCELESSTTNIDMKITMPCLQLNDDFDIVLENTESKTDNFPKTDETYDLLNSSEDKNAANITEDTVFHKDFLMSSPSNNVGSNLFVGVNDSQEWTAAESLPLWTAGSNYFDIDQWNLFED